jgi:hypothetical protein
MAIYENIQRDIHAFTGVVAMTLACKPPFTRAVFIVPVFENLIPLLGFLSNN